MARSQPVLSPVGYGPPPSQGAPPRGRRRRGCIASAILYVFGAIWGFIRLILATLLFFAILTLASYYVVQSYIAGKEEPAPNLTGLTVVQAMNHPDVVRLNLSLKLERMEPSNQVKEGEIVRQEPSAGVSIKARTPVRVVVSSGSKLRPLPDSLVSVSRREAGIQLRRLKLGVGRVAYVNVPGRDNDTVLAIDPPPGVGVPEGAKIGLLVASDAPNPSTTVPNLLGLTVDLARQEAERHGLTLEEINERTLEGPEPGTIVAQFPKRGEFITPNTRLSVDVAATPTPIPTPSPTPPPAAAGDAATTTSGTSETAVEAEPETAEPGDGGETAGTGTPAIRMEDLEGLAETPAEESEPGDAPSESAPAPEEPETAGEDGGDAPEDVFPQEAGSADDSEAYPDRDAELEDDPDEAPPPDER